jgi:hypothetical protein
MEKYAAVEGKEGKHSRSKKSTEGGGKFDNN